LFQQFHFFLCILIKKPKQYFSYWYKFIKSQICHLYLFFFSNENLDFKYSAHNTFL
jgi:hypothetical protein